MQISYIQTEIRGEELTNYVQHLTVVQRSFNELSVLSNKRLRDLETLLDFIQSTTTELICVNEKEEIETSRDWSSKSHHVHCYFWLPISSGYAIPYSGILYLIQGVFTSL